MQLLYQEKIGVMILIIFSVLFLHDVGASYSPIGTAYFIPDFDMLGDDLAGGYTFYKNMDNCIQDTKFPKLDSSTSYRKNTESFYSSVSSETSISVGLKGDFAMGVTLDATSKTISGQNRTVIGMTYNTYSLQSSEIFQSKCKTGTLDKDVKKAFEKLHQIISNPSLTSNWAAFDSFLRTYGSHLVTQVDYGSSLYQHTFSDASDKYSENQLKIKTCADLTGPTSAGVLNASVCTGVTKEDFKNVSSIKTSSRLVARGGSDETRNKLYSTRTNELIEEFLVEANFTHQPIRYKYTPVWILLKTIYLGTVHYAKALNMEAYFMGYLNYGCSYKVDGETALQQFAKTPISTNDYPVYNCSIPGKGCHAYDDCIYYFARRCYCAGKSCVEYTETTLNTGDTRTDAYIYRSGKGHEWQGCTKDWGTACTCTRTKSPRMVVWDLSQDYSFFSYAAHKNALNETTVVSGWDRIEL